MGDNVHDSTVAGAGGEKEQIEKIKKTIESGYHHWVSLDIKDFFSSLRPGHLKGFPLSKWKVENILFLPSDTPIKFVDQKHGVALVDPSVLKGYECDQSYGDVSYGQILSQVQLGLLQGDVCAPQIARTVLGKELQLTLGEMGIVWFSHLDDLAIGACSQKELKTALEALKTRLSSHPAGPLEFHEHKCSNVHEGFEFLKYRISIRKQDGVLHVRPAKSRFKRFRYRLWARLEDSGVYTKKGLWQCALKYASSWYISQQAWTKRTYVDESGNTVDASWECVLTELEYLVNKFIFDEWLDDIGNWHESDIKFDVIGEQEAIL